MDLSFQVVFEATFAENLYLKEIPSNKLHKMTSDDRSLWKLELYLPQLNEEKEFEYKLLIKDSLLSSTKEEDITRKISFKKGYKHFDLFWNSNKCNDATSLSGNLETSIPLTSSKITTLNNLESHVFKFSQGFSKNNLNDPHGNQLSCELSKTSSKKPYQSISKFIYCMLY